MYFFKRLTLAFFALGFSAISAVALDDADRANLDQSLAAYRTALETADFASVVAAIPPGVIDLISAQANLSPETIRKSVTAQMTTIMASATIESFVMDTDTMTDGTTPSDVAYAFLPTTTNLSIDEGPIQTVQTLTLAVDIDDTWYLMRIEQPQHYDFFRAAYPEFVEIPLPE